MDPQKPRGMLRHLTVQIRTGALGTGTLTGSGTGFFFAFQRSDGLVPLLITNKHVIEGAGVISVQLHQLGPDHRPMPGPGRPLKVALESLPVIRHPDPSVDMAAIAAAPLIQLAESQGWQPFMTSLGPSQILPPQRRAELSSIEDVTMVGYPIGLADLANNGAITRQGITATPASNDYMGRKEFLVDLAVFPGSSGSPVLIVNEGAFSTPTGLAMGSRLILLGILYAGHTRLESGIINSEPVPTDVRGTVRIQQMVHLGLCIHAERILELEALIPQ